VATSSGSFERLRENATKGNSTRIDRAKLKQAIREDHTKIFDVLANPPHCVKSLPLSKLLYCVDGFGKAKVNWVLVSNKTHDYKRIDEFTPRQLGEVARTIRAMLYE
jgi:hypothetical protein